MRSAIRCFVAVIVLALVTATAAEKPIDDDLANGTLELAEQAGLWIANSSVRTAEGTVWPDDALNPEVVSYDLASGVAGKVLFFIALYRATENPDYLELALGGAGPVCIQGYQASVWL